MEQTPARALHHHAEADAGDVARPPQNEGEGQQLIGWRLFVCFAIGAALWLGIVQLVAAGVPGSGVFGRILSVARLAILFVGVVSLCLAAMAGLNGILRKTEPASSRPLIPRS